MSLRTCFAFLWSLSYNRYMSSGGALLLLVNGQVLALTWHFGGRMVIRSHTKLQRMLEDESARLKTQLEHGVSRINEHVGYGNHMADDATEAFEQARDFSVRARLEDTQLEVQHALSKFELGTYGICEDCKTAIDWARLEAKPEARLCIKCQQRRDFER
jgi:RNA polymerase-binding transcription factor